ncbi:BREX-1 system adenine-specific DNA-methyltransferase PglX [Limimaricola sp. G21655-S1]|uniref:BREX-1 system adenine-specific DNA-methyltransferase PglX n=1 Tax=Limimaricola sp. G21655-S1 TaxID=3014768 RepID=UPI0022AEB586|nr:BREX-1 system adenine-specific DNA-methyltransferase PglX [Limimaricola sp. G21655-S1]MCZ4262599.1 BREX-1 system adenine-specific DNA-methyltransferase PglX [Limimaricola sp. G21655-S1]
MDTNALKKFAQSARNLLIDQVRAKLDHVLAEGAAARREHPQAIRELENAIRQTSRKQVIEQVAYTWFNRFTALRFMDANGYTQVRVVSPAEGATRPEILSEVMAGNLPDDAPTIIQSLLDGRTPSNDPQAEAYRLLLVHACNQWHGPMPFLFEELDDYTELLMPEDLLSQTSILAELRKVMTEDACRDVEIIGWLYQFYISEKKDQVFAGLKKNQKITAENIPAATQLFTPNWIVRYLVENSLGRLWLLNRPESRLAERMAYYIAPEEPETDFLKITRPEEIRICDPAAGSGHMLTYAFELLYAIYEEEGYEATEIPALILTHNLTGMEIDDRAGALAAFALAMKAAGKLGRRRFLRMEAKPDICVLQNVSFTNAEMQDVAAVVGKDLFTNELRETLGQFEQAKNFGSLIVPKLKGPAETLRVVEARDFGSDLLLKDVQARVVAVLRMAEALSPKYHVVVANPPYMGGKGMNGKLGEFAKKHFPRSKSDMMTCFMERASLLLRQNGTWGMINLPSWMFLSSFEKLRLALLENESFVSLLHLGRGIFGSDFGSVAFIVDKKKPKESQTAVYRRLFEKHVLVRAPHEIQELFLESRYGYFLTPQKNLLAIPGTPIAYWLSNEFLDAFAKGTPIQEYAVPRQGFATGENERFLRSWFEVSDDRTNFLASNAAVAAKSNARWFPCNKGGEFRKWYGNNLIVANWENDGAEMRQHPGSVIRNPNYYFKEGITWSTVTSGSLSMRYSPQGAVFETKGSVCFPLNGREPFFPLALMNTRVVEKALLAVSPTLDYHEGPIGKVPVIESQKEKVIASSKKLVEHTKSDWDANETSWDFSTLPLLSPDHRGETLADSYATLRARWQSMTDEMKTLEEENNRIFIDAYGLQDELTPEVPLEEITLTCNPAYRYGVKGSEDDRETRLRADTMAEFLSYAVGCMFGRYSLDAPGLVLANQGETLADYLARVPSPSFTPDADNVIPVLAGDWFVDDITERFRLFLRTTFGEQHFRENLKFIEDALGKDIRKYFTRDFYVDHVKRYKKRPIYWMFSSPKGTFNALIYLHRYRGDTVSVLLNDYLREFITKLEGERARLEKLSDDPAATQGQRTKALKDAGVVAKQVDELNEWEREVIFPLAQQKIEIDLDDGVKANYPKFGAALKKIVGLEAKDD